MYRRFLNARSPLRLLERGLHGGLGRGNLGLVMAPPGVGKTSFLVCVALDELLRGESVLHVSLGHTVSHVRAYYDTIFDDLASTSHLENIAVVHSEVDRLRRIRAYPPAAFDAKTLEEALALEQEAGARPVLVLVDGFDVGGTGRNELVRWREIARDRDLEIWITAPSGAEPGTGAPGWLRSVEDLFGVILTLESDGDTIALRALKDHENPDVAALHVALDPQTLLLVRN